MYLFPIIRYEGGIIIFIVGVKFLERYDRWLKMFIARQPIFNRKLEVYGYELLFRSQGESAQFDGTSSIGATASVLGGLFESGIKCLVENKFAFINFDEHFINSDSVELVPPESLIIEMLENVKINNNLINRLSELKSKGYKIALDDFVQDYADYPLVPIADIIKFDLIETPLHEIGANIGAALAQKKIILAEKIESQDEFLLAKDMGFHLFQGFFFSRPQIALKSNYKWTPKVQYMKLLEELREEEPSFQILAEIIETDVNLAYRMIRLASRHTAEEAFYSIKKALIYMGLTEFERWINILMLQDLGRNKPLELTKISLIRSKMADAIANHGGMKRLRQEASLMGLFSTLDAMLDMTMEEALQDIALTEPVIDALVHKKGRLYPIYDLILSYEAVDYIKVQKIARELNLEISTLYQEYIEAIEWASEIFTVMDG